MEINGRYSIRTIDGHTPDECKSAMQKYARRGIEDKMYYSVQQLNSLVRYSKDDREKVLPTIKAVRTNMINRLSVILFEDVSFRSIATFEKVCSLIKTWKDSRSDDVNGNDGSEILKDICRCLSLAKKARQPSFLRNYYGHVDLEAKKCDFEKMMRLPAQNQTPSFDYSFSWVYRHESDAVEWVREAKDFGNQRLIPLIQTSLSEWKRLKTSPRESDRLIFLVVPLLWMKYGWDEEPIQSNPKVCEISHLDRFDEYVYDMHTGRGKTKTKIDFVSQGSKVVNEDEKAVDSRMKIFYQRQEIPIMRMIRIPIFTQVTMITKGVCGGKLPCFYAIFRGEEHVVKPFTQSLNFGLDYAYVDAQKHRFGIPALNVKLVEIPELAVVKKGLTFELSRSDEQQVFAIMDVVNHKQDLGKHKDLLTDEKKYDEMLKVRLMNGLFRTSDNILRNILVRVDETFIPIDENDILGKRKRIFNESEPIKQIKYWSEERLMRIVAGFNLKYHKDAILNELDVYGLTKHHQELSDRIDRYDQIVREEFL